MAEKFDVYEVVTDRIISELEKGTVPWRKPWAAVDGSLNRNLDSGKPYRGINQLLLSLSGYGSPYWVTFKQAQKLGGSVRKGEKSTMVVFWKQFQVRDEAAKDGVKVIPMLRYYRVFNAEQCEGLTVPEIEKGSFDPIAQAEEIWGRWDDCPVSYGGDSACYVPAWDQIKLPLRESFARPEAFYSTAYHEAVHATGHESRLNRPEVMGTVRFGSEDYSREELVAELGSAMLCAHAGIVEETIKPSAAYIENWLSVLRGDRKLIIQAAGKAQRAADFILGEES